MIKLQITAKFTITYTKISYNFFNFIIFLMQKISSPLEIQ